MSYIEIDTVEFRHTDLVYTILSEADSTKPKSYKVGPCITSIDSEFWNNCIKKFNGFFKIQDENSIVYYVPIIGKSNVVYLWIFRYSHNKFIIIDINDIMKDKLSRLEYVVFDESFLIEYQ